MLTKLFILNKASYHILLKPSDNSFQKLVYIRKFSGNTSSNDNDNLESIYEGKHSRRLKLLRRTSLFTSVTSLIIVVSILHNLILINLRHLYNVAICILLFSFRRCTSWESCNFFFIDILFSIIYSILAYGYITLCYKVSFVNFLFYFVNISYVLKELKRYQSLMIIL